MPNAIAGVTKPNLFQDWYNIAVRPRIEGNTSFPGARNFLDEAGQPLPPAPAAEPLSQPPALNAPTAFPATDTPPADPGTEVAPPSAPGATIIDSLKSGVKAVGEGVQNLSQPAKMGLLGAGLTMMATPPRTVPYTNTEIMGRAGLGGLSIYEKALEDKRKADLMTQTAEEHKITQEDRRQANLDRAQYYRDTAETRKQNADTLELQREATTAYRETLKENADLLRAPVPDAVWDSMGKPELKGKGITGNQFKEYGLGNLNRPSPDKFTTSDDGTVTVIRDGKPIAQFHGMGKTKTPPAGAKGGKPTSLAERMALAEKSWRQDEANKGKEPTVADIAKRAQELFPPAAVQTAAAKKKTSSLRPGAAGAASAGNKRVKMPNGEVWEFNAAGDRVK